MGTLLRKEPIWNENDHALQAMFLLRRRLCPTRELLRKFRSLGLPLLFPALQGGQDKRGGGGSQGAPGVVSREASSIPARPRSSESEGVSLPAPLPRLLLPAHHSTLGDVMSREKFRRTAPLLDPPVLPEPLIEEQGRIIELALSRTALMTVAVVFALVPLTVRGRERRRRSSSRSLSSRERSQSLDRSRSRRVRSHSRGDRSRSSDRYRSHRDRSLSSDRYRSRRQRARSPARRGARGHAISLVILVDDFLPPLAVRGQRRKDSEPDESSRRVWRR